MREYALGIAVGHAAWLWFWLCGSLVRRPAADEEPRDAALLGFVLTTITGIALTGLITFGLGLIGAIQPFAFPAAAFGLVVAFVVCGDPPYRKLFWQRRMRDAARAASPGALVVYAVALVLAIPALVPDNGSDATAFYLPQALDYARAHGLVVDPWFRFPYYPNNWVLIETWPAVFGLGALGQFINWLCGALTLLGIYGSIEYGARRVGGRAQAQGISAIGVAGTLCLVLSATFVRVVNVGMIDGPSAMLFLATYIATLLGVRERGSRALACLVVCGGFLVGVKISFIALVPLLGALCAIVAASAPDARRRGISAVLVLLVLAAPWYVRAFALSGDPLEPMLNLRLHGVDPVFSRGDLVGQMGDLASDNGPVALLRLPISLFDDFKSRGVRDFGDTAIVILMPLAVVYVGAAFVLGRRRPTTLLLTAVCVTYGYAYWILTSHLGRYALLFLPCFIAFVGVLIVRLTARSVWLRYAGAGLMFALAVPSPASWNETLSVIWQLEIRGVGQYYTDNDTWLEQRSAAYPQIEDVAHLLHRARRLDLRVYVIELGGAQYFLKLRGITMIGDAFGPARFLDLSRALLRDDVRAYIERFNIGAFLVPRYALRLNPAYAGIEPELLALGWHEMHYPAPDWLLFTSPVLPPLVIGEGHLALARTGR